MPHAIVTPVIDYAVRDLCARAYPRHPRGCPNYGHRPTCPPAVPLYRERYDATQPVIAVWNVFDLTAHVRQMRERHPGWSQAQLECCLYWQGSARKALRAEIVRALHEAESYGMHAETCPEALGINVTATMQALGIELEWPPVTKTVQVAILAKSLRFYLQT